MKVPTIHLNGTAAQDLYDGYIDAYDKVREAIQAVRRAGPNGRDYYVQEPGAIQVAMAEHESRLDRLQAVYEELEVIVSHVMEGL